MRPRQCVNGITLWGKAKDTSAKISIMQDQFPCTNPNKFIGTVTGMIMEVVLLGEWQKKNCNAQYRLVNEASTTAFYFECLFWMFHWLAFIALRYFFFGGRGMFKIHQGIWFCLRFLGFLYIIFWFYSTIFSPRQVPNLCMHVIKWTGKILMISKNLFMISN